MKTNEFISVRRKSVFNEADAPAQTTAPVSGADRAETPAEWMIEHISTYLRGHRLPTNFSRVIKSLAQEFENAIIANPGLDWNKYVETPSGSSISNWAARAGFAGNTRQVQALMQRKEIENRRKGFSVWSTNARQQFEGAVNAGQVELKKSVSESIVLRNYKDFNSLLENMINENDGIFNPNKPILQKIYDYLYSIALNQRRDRSGYVIPASNERPEQQDTSEPAQEPAQQQATPQQATSEPTQEPAQQQATAQSVSPTDCIKAGVEMTVPGTNVKFRYTPVWTNTTTNASAGEFTAQLLDNLAKGIKSSDIDNRIILGARKELGLSENKKVSKKIIR